MRVHQQTLTPAMAACSRLHVCPRNLRDFDQSFHHRVTYAQSYRQIGQCSSCFESWRPVSICWSKNERACGRIGTLSAKSQPSGLSNNSALCTDRSNVIRTASGKDAGGEEESNCPACVILPGEHGKKCIDIPYGYLLDNEVLLTAA